MLYKMGIIFTILVVIYHWVLSQVTSLVELKDFFDTGLTVAVLWFFINYLIKKEKAHSDRLQKKDEEIMRLNEKLHNNNNNE